MTASKPTIANLGLSATPIFRPLNEIMNKAGPRGAPPSCADQVLAKLCPILPAPPIPSTSARPADARYTPAELIIQLQPAIQLYRFSRSQEVNAIIRCLPQCFRPTESEETQMYEYLFKTLETQDVRRYYELKAQQLRREAYPESLTVLGRKATQRPPNQSLNPSSVLYPSPVPSPGSLPKRGASTASSASPMRHAPSHASSPRSVPTANAEDGVDMPSLPKLNEYIVKEVLSKVQDQNGKRQSRFTPPNTPTKPKARNSQDKAVAGRVKKEMSRLLADEGRCQTVNQSERDSSSRATYVASAPRSYTISQIPRRSTSLPKTPRKLCKNANSSGYLQALPLNRQFSTTFLQSPLLSPAASPRAIGHFSIPLRESPMSSPFSQTLPSTGQFSNTLLQNPALTLVNDVFSSLATPLDPFMPLDVRGSMHHSFGSSLDINSALLSAPLQVPDMNLNQPSAGNFMNADFANEYSMYFYNKGFGDAQASHGLAQNALWMHSQPPANMFLDSGPVFIPPTSTQGEDGLSLSDLMSAGTPRISVYDTSNHFLNSNPGVALDKARLSAGDRSLSDILGLSTFNS
ncbi:hypothetical protein BJ741DRAFT_172681 [Chytriomyces cf. hyalinus JEL632]|nr:hypothetical protein BJ741DRAFT_172681 [Chytriomyces cf. hyalinus JEL632]